MADSVPVFRRVFMVIAFTVAVFIALLIARAVHTLYSVSSYKKSWQIESKAPIRKDALVVVGLGDSTVQGVGALRRSDSFIFQVSERAARDLKKDIQIYNFSVSGAESGEVLETQLPSVKKLSRIDAIVLAVGPNDLVHKKSIQSFLKSYESILKQLPTEKLIIAELPPMGPKGVEGKGSYAWTKQLRRLAKEYDVRVAPVYAAIEPRANDFRTYGGDFFHPSGTGYSLWANAFEQPLIEVLRSKK